MDKYRGNMNWNRELKELREKQEKDEKYKKKEISPQNQSRKEMNQQNRPYRPEDYHYMENNQHNGITWQTALGATLGIGLVGGFLYALVKFTDLFTDPNKRNAMVNVESAYIGKTVGGVLREGFSVLDEREIRIAREKAKIEVEKAQQLENIRLAKKAEDAAKARKEAAFKQFYQKPDHCYAPERTSIRVECANEYIRARKRFNIAYQE